MKHVYLVVNTYQRGFHLTDKIVKIYKNRDKAEKHAKKAKKHWKIYDSTVVRKKVA